MICLITAILGAIVSSRSFRLRRLMAGFLLPKEDPDSTYAD
jgi:hypothetical protein